jgi:hypothetical protein
MPDVLGQRQNDDSPVQGPGPASTAPSVDPAAWPNYLPAVILAGALAFIMAAVTVLIVNGG